ncbi:MAG: alpha/beta fold hydrolase [Myxococcota bacterium]
MWILAALALAIIVVALVVYVRRDKVGYRLRRRLGRDVPRFPIVLIHGFMGFDRVAGIEYFRGIRASLEAEGIRVVLVRLPPTGSIQSRAEALMKQIADIEGDLNLVAHSMGGLDARYALAHLGLAERTRSLITVATPHHGTPVAALGKNVVQAVGIKALAKTIGFDLTAIDDLTPQQLESFNADTTDAPGVFYGCVVARAETVHPLLQPTYSLLARKAPSDGLIPTESQCWGTILTEIDADHWAQIGWGSTFDAEGLFRDIARELALRGF